MPAWLLCFLQTKLNALACLDRLLDSLDKMIILDEVIPFMTEITCSDVDIVMSVTGKAIVVISWHSSKCQSIFNGRCFFSTFECWSA